MYAIISAHYMPNGNNFFKCEVCEQNIAQSYYLKKHLLNFSMKLIHCQGFQACRTLHKEVGNFLLSGVIFLLFDADTAFFIRIELEDLIVLFKFSDLKEKLAPPVSQHKVEVKIHLGVLA